MLCGKTFFRSIAVDNPEHLRKSLLLNKEFITSFKLFLNKDDYSDLKQTSRLMHQYYSEDVNAPIELKKSIRLMKKSNTDMKELKKSLSTKLIHSSSKNTKRIKAKMSRKIVDF